MSLDREPNPQAVLVAAEAALDLDDLDRAEEAASEALSQIRQLQSQRATGGDD